MHVVEPGISEALIPSETERRVAHGDRADATVVQDDEEEEQQESTEEHDDLRWSYLIKEAHLQKSARQVERYVLEKFIPKCERVATMKIDPLAADQRMSAVHGLGGIEYVDVLAKTHSHGLKAKHVALLILRRMRLYRATHYVVTQKKAELLDYLKSDEGRNVDELPVWWCPWIHDYGLMMGIKKYGVAAWRQIRDDASLPFHPSQIQKHIRMVFLQGNSETNEAPKANDAFPTRSSLTLWFKSAADEFPSASVLEFRIQHICALLTRELPHEDANRMEEPDRKHIPTSKAFDAALCVPEKNDIDPSSRYDEMLRLQTFIRDTKGKRDKLLRETTATGVLNVRLQQDEPHTL